MKVFNSDNKNLFIFEDEPNDDSNYIDSDLDYLIAKTMLSSFSFINEKYQINFELEDEKRTTNKIMTNLLCNIENGQIEDKKNDNDVEINEIKDISENKVNKLKYVHSNDIQQLYKLLNKHHNRAVCLQSLSHFRISGNFCFPPYIFDVIGKCLLIIIDEVIKDEDYHMAKTAMILSQTYFKMDNRGEKYYLQNIIKDHKLFTNTHFWEKVLDISLRNEVNRVKNIRNKNEDNSQIKEDKNNKLEDDLEKFNDIAFGQIISLVNSMIDFDINIVEIKKIIEPKIEEYKLNENHKKNIDLVIQNKINLDNNGKKINSEIKIGDNDIHQGEDKEITNIINENNINNIDK